MTHIPIPELIKAVNQTSNATIYTDYEVENNDNYLIKIKIPYSKINQVPSFI
jgi:hypothetical protein